jgi:hypothetical protein
MQTRRKAPLRDRQPNIRLNTLDTTIPPFSPETTELVASDIYVVLHLIILFADSDAFLRGPQQVSGARLADGPDAR